MRKPIIYFLTEDSRNDKERNELQYLQKLASVVLVTTHSQTTNALGLRQIVVSPRSALLARLQRLWMRLCLLFGRLADSNSDMQFPRRNVYSGNCVSRALVNFLWKIKTFPGVNRCFPSYDQLYFAPIRLWQFLHPVAAKGRQGRYSRIVIHDALLLRLEGLAPMVCHARTAGWMTIANVKSWDNPFYSQLATRPDGYLVWGESMWADICTAQRISRPFHVTWGARPFYKFIAARAQHEDLPSARPAAGRVIGFAAAFCDEYMGRYEVALVKQIAEYLLRALPDARIRFRPYPILPAEFYASLNALPNIDFVSIQGDATDRFGDGREVIKFGSDTERLDYLGSCDCFLSLATSFTIEAAVAGLPIVQFYLDRSSRTTDAEKEVFLRFDISDHLHKYFLGNLPVARGYAELAEMLAQSTAPGHVAIEAGRRLMASMGVPLSEQCAFEPDAHTRQTILSSLQG